MFDPDAPSWVAGLEGCAQRVHMVTLGVFNPYLTQLPQILPKCMISFDRLERNPVQRGLDLIRELGHGG